MGPVLRSTFHTASMKIRLSLVAALCLAGCTAVRSPPPPTAPSPPAPPPMTYVEPNANLVVQGVPPIPQSLADDVARYTDFRGHALLDWHPRLHEMLVAHRDAGASTTQLFRVNKAMGEAEQLTSFADPVNVASYEPTEGRYIVFERSVGGDEAAQIYRLDLDTRNIALLSEPGRRHRMEAWLHRSSRLLMSSVPLDRTASGGKREKVTQTLSIIDPARPTTRQALVQLDGTGWDVGGISWDDRLVALTRYISANESQVWIFDLQRRRLRQLLPAPHTKGGGVYMAVGFQQGNAGLFVLTDHDGEFREMSLYRFSNRRLTPVTKKIPWDIDGAAISDNGARVALRANVEGREDLHLFDARTLHELPKPHLPAGSVGAMSFQRASGDLAFSMSSAHGPSQIYSLDTSGGILLQWTQAYAPPGVDMSQFPDQDIVRWKSFDRRTISGLLTKPPATFTGPRPVLVLIHGGPESQARAGFMGRYNYFVNELGIAIIEPNVRGSSGYGKTFLTLDNGMHREDAVRDVGALLDWIATQPQFDARRVLVSGGSYGGYMSLACATHYAARIAGAIDVVGISNFVTFLEHTESYRRDLRRVEYGDERDPKMRAFLESISPLAHADKITRPLFVVQGRNDPRVPYTEAEQMVAKARENGTPAWYLRAENEGHGFVRKENADYFFYATVMFIRRTLMAP